MIRKFDFLIIGSGVAGMCYALHVARANKGKVALVCKTTLEEANTAKAQGGVASVTNLEVDNFEKHIKDTMIAGDYISDPAAVEKVVREAPAGIKFLVDNGVHFDKKEDGTFDLHREGGTRSSAYFTTPTTPASRYSADLSKPCGTRQTSQYSKTTLP